MKATQQRKRREEPRIEEEAEGAFDSAVSGKEVNKLLEKGYISKKRQQFVCTFFADVLMY